jgi:hypothetical protein
MTNEKLCCDLEHAKLLAETGLMKDVEADGCFLDTIFYSANKSVYIKLYGCYMSATKLSNALPTYRLDKILAMLPEWCYSGELYVPEHQVLHAEDLYWECQTVLKLRGQPAANAAAKLLHLLWEEKLI